MYFRIEKNFFFIRNVLVYLLVYLEFYFFFLDKEWFLFFGFLIYGF